MPRVRENAPGDEHGRERFVGCSVLAWCDPAHTLGKQYAECATRARDCRDRNTRNGVLVGAQIKRVEGLLGAMTGTSAEPRAYGPRGQSNAYAAASGKVLSAEA